MQEKRVPLLISYPWTREPEADQWQKSEEIMKNVAGSFQYFSKIELIWAPFLAEPTMRGTSFRSSRLLVS